MFRPFSIREIYRYMIPGVLLFCVIYLMIHPIKWGNTKFFEIIMVVLISSVILGTLLEPIMTLLGMVILNKHIPKYYNKIEYTPKYRYKIPKWLLGDLNTETLEKNVKELLFGGIWVLINPDERELLWNSTATYYLYGSYSLILFFNSISIWFQLCIKNIEQLHILLLVSIISFVLGFVCLKQLTVYLEITNSYLSYFRKKYKEDIKERLDVEKRTANWRLYFGR